MKKETGKKNKLWLWIVIAVVVLAIIGAVAAFVLPGLFQDNGPAGPVAEAKLYWNLDRKLWLEEETGMSLRQKGEDGYYHISYLVDGKIEDIKVSDKQLVNYLDSQDLLCLAFDEAGICVDAVSFDTYFVETAKDLFVKRFQNNTLEINSSIGMDGMNMQIVVPEGFPIVEVSEGAEQKGTPITPDWLDACSAYTDLEGNLAAIYITGHNAIDAEVAWIINTMNSRGVHTQPDENGIYTLDFAIDGKIQQRKCRDWTVVQQMETAGSWDCSMALEYDEEGYIIDYEVVQMAIRGIKLYSEAIVENVDGNHITGNTATGVPVDFMLDEECVIYNVCNGNCYEENEGEVVKDIYVGDRLHVYTDLDGKTILIFKVVSHMDGPLYYRLSKTTDADGYFVYEFAVDGKIKTYKTKDAEIAAKVDSKSDKTMALELSGSIIKNVGSYVCVTNGYRRANGSFVTSAQPPVLTWFNYSDPTTMVAKLMNADCKVYLVDGNYKTKMGSVTELQQYDRIVALGNPSDELVYIYVTQRYKPGHKLAVNLSRQYAGTETTRVPDEQGYYVFDIACEGKQMQVKTKDKAMASFVDSQNYQFFGFKANNGILTSVVTAESVFPYAMKTNNFGRVESTENNVLQTWYSNSGMDKVMSSNMYTLTSKTKIYNVTKDAFAEYPGEKTKLRKYDHVQALTNAETGEIQYVFVMDRPLAQTKLYANVASVPPIDTVPNRTPDKDGYYTLKLFSDGKTITVRVKDPAICAQIDAIGDSMPFGLTFEKGTNIVSAFYAVADTQYFQGLGPVDVVSLGDGTFTVRYPGKTTDYVLNRAAYKVIDLRENSKTRGKTVSLKKGMRIRAYNDGETGYVFVLDLPDTTPGTELVLDAKGYGMCTACGEKVKWTKYDGSKQYLEIKDHQHFYLVCDTEMTHGSSNAMTIIESGKVCFHLNGCKLTTNGGRFWLTGTAAEDAGFNLIGTNGEIVYNTRSPIQQNRGEVNIIGGTYTPTGGYVPFVSTATRRFVIKDATVHASLVSQSTATHFVLQGSTIVHKVDVSYGGKLELDSSWTGTAILGMTADELTDSIVPAGKAFYTGDAPKGVVTLASGETLKYVDGFLEILYPEELILDDKGYGECPTCGKVKWEKYDGKKQYADIATHRHFYLAENVTYTNAATDLMTLVAGGKVCLHLNSYNLTVNDGRILLSHKTSALNIYTEHGKIYYSNPTNPFIQQDKGAVTVSGGTYVATNTTAPFGTATGKFTLNNANVKGIVVSAGENARIKLEGDARVTKINLDAGGKLELDSSWTGTALLDMKAEDLVNGKVPADKVSYSGKAPTGVLKLASGEILKYTKGKLEIDTSYTDELIVDAQGYGVCPVCDDNVLWTVFDGTRNYTDITDHRHFYLAEDTSYDGDAISANMILVSSSGNAYGNVCFHLNGHTLTVNNARFWLGGAAAEESVFNLFGENGKIKYTGSAIIQQNRGNVYIYGGTYIPTDTEDFISTATRRVTILDAVVKGNLTSQSIATRFVLQGSTKVGKINVDMGGKLELDSNWTGSAILDYPVEDLDEGLVPNSVASYRDPAPTGTVKLVSGEKLVYRDGMLSLDIPQAPPLMAFCEACGEEKAWTKFSGKASFTELGVHRHFYLAEDVTYDGNLRGKTMLSLASEGKVCFNLMGHTLTVEDAQIFLMANDETNVFNLFGEGGEIKYRYNSYGGFFRQGYGAANIYGGTYTPLEGNEQPFMTSTRTTVIKDATIKGTITAWSANANRFKLQGSTTVKNIDFTADGAGGKLELNSDWTGSAKLTVPEAYIVDNRLDPSRFTYIGEEIAGTLKLSDGRKLVYQDGEIVLDGFQEQPYIAKCEACGEEVTWTRFSGTKQYTGITTHRHFYLADDVTYDGATTGSNILLIGAGGSACFDLNGKTLTVNDARFWLGGAAAEDAVLNIFANGGKIKYTNRAVIQQNRGYVNIYGGTYIPTGTEDFIATATRRVTLVDAVVKGNITSQSTATRVVLQGKSKVNVLNFDLGGKLELDSNWTGTAILDVDVADLDEGLVPSSIASYKDPAPTGTVKLVSGEKLVYRDGMLSLDIPQAPPLMAFCDACGEEKAWTKFSGKASFTDIGVHRHFYLAEDVTYDGNVRGKTMLSLASQGKVCFNLMGHTLTVEDAQIYLAANDETNVFNLFGAGGQIKYRYNNYGGFFRQGYGAANIYGGTYTPLEGNEQPFMTSTRTAVIKDATINGTITAWSGAANKFKLQGSTTVKNIDFTAADAGGKLELNSDWTGSAVLTVPEAYVVNNRLDPSRFTYIGEEIAGTLKLSDGRKLVYQDGEIVLDGFQDPPYIAKCDACGQNVEWTKFTGTKSYTGITTHRHFYLADNATYEGAVSGSNMILIGAGGSVCFDLNGKILTVNDARFWLGGAAAEDAVLNIFANGGKINYANKPVIQQNRGNVNIYGGTYTPTGTEAFIDCATRRVTLVDAVVNGNLTSQSTATRFVLQGSTKVGKINVDLGGKLELNSNWTGSAILDVDASTLDEGLVPSSIASYSDPAPTGTVKLPNNEALIYRDGQLSQNIQQAPPLQAHCDACGETVDWTKFTGKSSFTDISTHRHFYLENDVIYDGNVRGKTMMSLISGGKVCFNLMGHTLTVQDAQIYMSANDESNVFNLFGTGGEIKYRYNNYGGFFRQGYGSANIYGGTYTPLSGNEQPFMTSTRVTVIKDATINGTITAWSKNVNKFKLQGSTTVQNIDFTAPDAGGKLEIGAGWSGSATLTIPEAYLVGFKLDPTRFSCVGEEIPGELKLSDGRKLAFQYGEIILDGHQEPPYEAMCPVCNEEKIWTKFDGTTAYSVTNGHKHYYLAGDVTETISTQALINIGKESDTEYGSVCFNLNGHTLTVENGYFYLSPSCKDYASTLNIIAGDGGAINYSGRALVDQRLGILNVFGGTYTGANGEAFASCLTRNVTLTDAKIGNLVSQSNATNITLKGTTETGTIDFTYGESGYNSTLNVDGTWTGKATLTPYDGALVDGVLNTAKYKYTGTPTGTLKLSTDVTMEFKDGEIRIPQPELPFEEDCPICGEVTWTKFNGTQAFTVTNEHKHFYLAGDVTETISDKALINIGKDSDTVYGSVCFYLNGHTLTVDDGYFYLSPSCKDYASTLNIIAGEGGAINYSGRALVDQRLGILNVIGGTYTGANGESFADCLTRNVTLTDAKVGKLVSQSNATSITLKGATETGTIDFTYGETGYNSTLNLDGSWTGKATLTPYAGSLVEGVLNTAKYKYTGTPTGTLKLSTGETMEFKDSKICVAEEKEDVLILDDNNFGECPVCGNVQWTAFDGTAQFTGISDQRHYYLADDTTYTNGSVNMITISAGGKVCFHLNGRKLTIGNTEGKARFWQSSSATGSVLNIFGEGGGEIDCANRAIIQANGGTTNIYGGTYGSSVAGMDTFADVTEGTLNIDGATVNGNIVNASWKGVIKLAGAANVGKITLDYPSSSGGTLFGKLELDTTWSGSATLDMEASELTDGKVPTTVVSYDKNATAPTGTVKLASSETLVYKDGGLELDQSVTPPPAGEPDEPDEDVLVLDGNNNGFCPACDGYVQWTAYDGTKQYTGIANSQHLYLTGDTHYSYDSVNMITMTTGGKLCFHLNGKILTVDRSAGARIWVNSNCVGLNLFGEGGGIVNNNYNTIQHNGGYVNVYGGTYTDTTENNKFASTSSAQGGMMLQNVDAGTIAFNGTAATVQLQGSTVVGKVILDYVENGTPKNGKLELASDWTGSAVLDMQAADLTDGKVPTTKVFYSGVAPTGIVKLASSETLAYVNGSLEISNDAVPAEAQQKITAAAAIAALDPAAVVQGATCPMCKETVTDWEPLTARVDVAANAHIHYVATGTLHFTDYWAIKPGANSQVCVVLVNAEISSDGPFVYGEGAGSVVNIMGNGTVTSTFSGSKGTGYGVNAGIGFLNSMTANIYGGTYIHTPTTNNREVGAFMLNHKDAVLNMYAGVTIGRAEQDKTVVSRNVYVAKSAVFNMYGGTIRNGNSSYGGNLDLRDGGNLNMYGGAIENGYSYGDKGRGGNIYVSHFNGGSLSVINMYGGRISGGEATSFGGNIDLETGSINVYGGTISGGVSPSSGGNIYCGTTGVTNTISGGKISDGTAANGGNLYMYRGTLNVTGGTIENGTATGSGANIYMDDSASLTLQNATVTGTSSNSIYAAGLTVEGGTYTGGMSLKAAATIKDATVEGDVDLTTGNSVVTLQGNTNITGNINFKDTYNASKVVVDATFSGTATLNPNEGMYIEGAFEETQGEANGDFTGILNVITDGATPDKLVHSEGKLVKAA